MTLFSVQFFHDGEQILPVLPEIVPYEQFTVKREGETPIPCLFMCEEMDNRPKEIEKMWFEVKENFPLSMTLTNLTGGELELIVNLFYIDRRVLWLKPKETITINTMKNRFIANPPTIPLMFSPSGESDQIVIEGKTYTKTEDAPSFTYAKAYPKPLKRDAEEKRCVFSIKQ